MPAARQLAKHLPDLRRTGRGLTMTDTIKISRELLERICGKDGEDMTNEAYVARHELRQLLATPPADAADMGGQAGEEVEVVAWVNAETLRDVPRAKLSLTRVWLSKMQSEEDDTSLMTVAQHLRILAQLQSRFDSVQSAYQRRTEMFDRISDQLAQHRQQAGKLVEALEEIASAHGEQAAVAAKALADWEKTNGN
jgi:uncharacterized protein YukE